MNVWIARDPDGRLFMHFTRPHIDIISNPHWHSTPYTHQVDVTGTPLDKKFEDLTFLQGPRSLVLDSDGSYL